MSEFPDELAGALHRLRDEIRDRVAPPPAAGLRARAIHRLRVRRTATALVAAVAVVAIAGGGNALLRPTAGPPVPPVDSPEPTVTPAPEPTPTPELTPPPVTPSPRPAPREPEPLDDPIAEVDWGTVTITLPPEEGCPAGPVVPATGVGPDGHAEADRFPALFLLSTEKIAYGDLTGNGRPEAVLEVQCLSSEGPPGQHGGRLLVLTWQGDGELTGLGFASPPGALLHTWWVADGRLLMAADPWVGGPEDSFDWVPGLVLAYQWDGSGFGDGQPAPDYPPIVPLDTEQAGPPVRPRAVGVGLGCQADELRFAQTGDWTATTPGASYTIPFIVHQQLLFDLDRTGEHLLVVALSCTRAGGVTRHGLAVFERAGDGWQGISVLLHPAGYQPGGWQMNGDLLEVGWFDADGNGQPAEAYRWTGTVLEPIDE